MVLDFLQPEVFDALIIINIILGLLVAGRRFRQDLRGPLPADAPEWASEPMASAPVKSAAEDA